MSENNLNNQEAEKVIIGSILAQPECMNLLGDLGHEDFFFPHWKVAFFCCLNLWQRGETINTISVFDEYEKLIGDPSNKEKVSGDMALFLAQAQAAVVNADNAELSAREVRDLAVRRRGAAAMQQIYAAFHDRQSPLIEALDKARAAIDELNWAPQSSRFVLFREGIEIGGEHPIYEFQVVRPSDCCAVTIRVKSEQLDKRIDLARLIREALHFNPKLPAAEKWGDFINNIVSITKRTDTPEALKEDSEIIFWLREWFKTATPAETADDLINGYVLKKDYYYVQPQRVLSWLTNHAKIKPTISELWAVVARFGARRDVGIKLKDKSRRLWGIPVSLVEPGEEETQLGIEDVNLEDYVDSEEHEEVKSEEK